MRLMKSFLGNEDGAVTVDWVVLTAATVGLGVGVPSRTITLTLGDLPFSWQDRF
jgi:hypothetical protein